MKKHEITISKTKNDSIIKLESNQFLTEHKAYEFSNIDEAQPSPLAQQLFHLPFVKTVYIAQNFVALAKFDIVEWEDVEQELAEQVESYLNSTQALFTIDTHQESVAVTIYAEATPNPSVMKFVANKKLAIQPTEFKSIEHTEVDSLSRKLIQLPFIKELYIDENYISITKYDINAWEEITNELRSYIKSELEKGGKLGDSSYSAGTSKSNVTKESSKAIEQLDEISKSIVDILDEYVKPAVASDGGNIVFESYNPQEKEVRVILQGACSGCPSSTMTLRNGIETMLKDMLDGKVQRVVAING